MGKGTHFLGQPILNQLLNYFNKQNILQISRDMGGERYVKSFNAWCHLTVMLYAVIMRFDSLREITSATMMEWRKLAHLGIKNLPRRSTLSDANARRSHEIFGKIYQRLYLTYKDKLSSDSPSGNMPKWMEKLQIIDSTTISLFSNLIFKGVGRNPKTGKKKGGMKVHTCIQGNEGVPCDVEFTSAATHDHFMLCPGKLNKGDILAIDRAYIDYAKFEEIVSIYKARWAIESLFKQIKQNFPLRYFYGESANAIKIQVWVTLIANLLITLLQKGVSRSWSFFGLATIVRIMLMYYIDVQGFLEHPEKDWEEALAAILESPPEADEAEI